MLSLFNKFNSNQQKETDEVYQLLQEFYDSFFCNMYGHEAFAVNESAAKADERIEFKNKAGKLELCLHQSPK